MTYTKRWSVDDIVRQINSAYYTCSDPRQDGFTTWGIKQDLYQIKFILDDIIKKCPTYAPEDEWLKEQEQKKIIKYLKDEN
jgi:hypothetical protein